VGNNIANVNSLGFKSSRVTFKEMYNQSMRAASTPSPVAGGVGGMNPMQVGLGVRVGSIDQNMSASNIENTGFKSDMAVDGRGFFVLRVGDSSQLIYTRAGNFTRDGAGFLVHTGTGNRLQGYLLSNPEDDSSISGSVTDIQVPFSDFYPPSATTIAEIFGNLNHLTLPNEANEEGERDKNWLATLDVYDRLGQRHTILCEFFQAEEPDPENPTWRVVMTMASPWEAIDGGEDIELTFDTNGQLIYDETGEGRYYTVTLSNGDPDDPETAGLRVGGFTEEMELIIDFGKLTQLAGKTDALARRLNGNEYGNLSNWEVDENGVMTLYYSNGESRMHARIALANFPNDEGLTKLSDTTWRESNNSGAVVIAIPNTGDFGKVVSGGIEMSNVDLAYEFTNLVITQRGYQANARVISTSDEILQELVNIKR